MEKPSKHEAGAQFAKMQRAGKTAPSDYEVTAEALRARTAKLKALRLERDAANPPPPAAPKRQRKAKGTSGKLSEWLDGQAKEGRQS